MRRLRLRRWTREDAVPPALPLPYDLAGAACPVPGAPFEVPEVILSRHGVTTVVQVDYREMEERMMANVYAEQRTQLDVADRTIADLRRELKIANAARRALEAQVKILRAGMIGGE